MSIENEGATSDVELESVLACKGDLPVDEPANFEGTDIADPTPFAPSQASRETTPPGSVTPSVISSLNCAKTGA
jgi:hypothetical protein